jgi:hypothetical protein
MTSHPRRKKSSYYSDGCSNHLVSNTASLWKIWDGGAGLCITVASVNAEKATGKLNAHCGL